LHQREIRDFRGNLRQFERVTNLHLKTCCADVTLAQCLVLLEVEGGERPTVSRLASRLRLDNSTLTRTLDGLVKRGLVERHRNDRDRRVVWIRLTDEGKTVVRSIHRDNDAHYRRVFKKIPQSRRATVMRSFAILVQALLDCEAESGTDTCRDSTSPPEPTRRRSERHRGGP
jgi:DNA-binding MarR family transcriptional regulator